MMSLFDKNKQNTTIFDDWKPIDLDSIQHIDDERFLKKKKKDKPDYNLFKLIYEDSRISDQDSFKFFYEPDVNITDSQSDTSHEFKELFQEDDKNVNATDEDKFRFTEDSDMGDETKFSKGTDIKSGMNGIKASGLPDESGGDMSDHIKPDSGVNTGTDNESGQDLCHNLKNDTDPPDSDIESGRNGYEKGFEQGFEKGKEDGLIQGRAEGEKQGYAEGFAKGENEAKKTCDAKAVEILSSLEDILLKADDAWKELVKKYENQIISLVCRIAEKVVLARVKIDNNIVKQSIFRAMEKMPEPEEISLHISPDDYEYIEMIKEEFFDKVKGLTSVSIVSDPSVTGGGCRIESSKGKIETSIESRLEAVLSSIVKAGEL